MNIKGLDKLIKKLDKIEKKEAKKIIRRAARQAQNLTTKKARSNASAMVGGEMGGKIAKATKTLSPDRPRKGQYQIKTMIDPKHSNMDDFIDVSKDGNRNFIPAALEHGHKKRGGGTVPAIPYMREAAESTEQSRLNKLAKEIKKGLDSVK